MRKINQTNAKYQEVLTKRKTQALMQKNFNPNHTIGKSPLARIVGVQVRL